MDDTSTSPQAQALSRLQASRQAIASALLDRRMALANRPAPPAQPWPLLAGAAAVGALLVFAPWRGAIGALLTATVLRRVLGRWALRAGAGWLLRSAFKG
jgi:hypothetical protein